MTALAASSVKKVFEEIAGEWAEYRKEPSPVLSYFISLTPRGATALDAGCGNGRNTVEIAKKAGLVYGVDFSKKMLEHARALAAKNNATEKTVFIEGDVRRLPLRAEAVEAVFSLAALHHLETPEDRMAAFREMARVLKKRGKAFLAVWNKRQKKFENVRGSDALVSWKTRDGRVLKRFYHFFEPGEIVSLARAAGFSVREVFYEKNGKKCGGVGAANMCAVLEKL